MKKIWVFLFLTLFLYAQNPKIYRALGDVIYTNAPKIGMLTTLDAFQVYKSDIAQYILDVTKAKTYGFALENGDHAYNKQMYLNKLRELSKRNDFFLRNVDRIFQNSLKNQNTKLFSALVNSGLINTQKYKKVILEYYFQHADTLKPTGIIKKYLEEDAALRAKREAQRKRYKSKKQRERERIEYLREKDRREQEQLERELDEKLRKKKLEIREYQKKELSKTI